MTMRAHNIFQLPESCSYMISEEQFCECPGLAFHCMQHTDCEINCATSHATDDMKEIPTEGESHCILALAQGVFLLKENFG